MGMSARQSRRSREHTSRCMETCEALAMTREYFDTLETFVSLVTDTSPSQSNVKMIIIQRIPASVIQGTCGLLCQALPRGCLGHSPITYSQPRLQRQHQQPPGQSGQISWSLSTFFAYPNFVDLASRHIYNGTDSESFLGRVVIVRIHYSQ